MIPLLLTVLFMVTFTITWWWVSRPMRELRRQEEAGAKLPEIPPLDPMVLCPACGLMGHHSLELTPAKTPAPIRTMLDEDGEEIHIYTWQSAAGRAEHYERRCLFCSHVWTVPL